ncbi:cation transporter [Treponema pectinovorum]|uniref:cation transporter n=1 Tax=Treponema pectinovorum TaxID=164 RepID=UPI0011C912BA|nr:cation transporter [Treponema pectinovorum]
MQKKIYVVGMLDAETCAKVENAVKAVAGVNNCVANFDKAQVLVDFEGADEAAINSAISSLGIEVLN